jgi:hypothetical protein
MTHSETIAELAESLSKKVPKRYKQKILLYTNGISAKLSNAYYSHSNLIALKNLPDDYSSTDDLDVPVPDRIHFFTDSFFAFLYSSFDVTAQVINQKLRLGIDEHRVSIKKVKEEIDKMTPVPSLKRILDSLFKSKYFKNLERYRNCSTHRRQIYLKTTTVSVSETPGYTSTAKLTEVKRILCDDPLSLNPTVRQSRELISYTSELYNKVEKEIYIILKNI